MKKLFLTAICLLLTLSAFADTFQYTYEGKTLNYSTISDSACEVSNNPGTSGVVSIPKTVTYNDKEYTINKIGNDAFKECLLLKSITIPNSVTSIGNCAFLNCGYLKSITIPSSVRSIGNGAFIGCGNLKSLTLPDSISDIKDDTFESCWQLTSITIPESVTSIGAYAFASCSSLSSITIPKSVRNIGKYAFSGCSGLTSITLPTGLQTIADATFESCKNLTAITIPNSVTSIDNCAFIDCENLKTVTLPNSLESIGKLTFLWCKSLDSITSLAANPPTIIAGNYPWSPSDWTLYVPNGSVNAYKHADWWKEFGSIQPIKNMQSVPINDRLKVSGCNGSIAVENASIGATVVVKDINNATVANEVVTEANQSIPVNRKGVFIVNVDNATFKVAL